MPTLTVFHPSNFLATPTQWDAFLDALQEAAAEQMDAIDPETGKVTDFDPKKHIDVLSVEYDPNTSRPTAVVLINVVTYEWPDRMDNMPERLGRIAEVVKPFVRRSAGIGVVDSVAVTFLGKGKGCWVAL